MHEKGYTAAIVLKIKGAIIHILGGQDLYTLALTLLLLLCMQAVVLELLNCVIVIFNHRLDILAHTIMFY